MASGSPLLGGDSHTSELSAPSSPSSRIASGLAKPFIGRTVLLRNGHARYMRCTASGVVSQSESDDSACVWKLEAAPNGSDDYVCISNYVHEVRLSALTDAKTVATTSNRGGLETFRVLPGFDGRFVFETTHNTHLSQDESGALTQSTSSPSSWQQFDVIVKPSAAVSRHPSQGKLDVSVSLTPLDISTAGSGAPGEAIAASPKASTSTAKKQSLIAKIGNFLSPGGRTKKPSVMMGDSSADINDPSLQPIGAAGYDSKSRESSVTRKYSLSQSQGGGIGTASPSPQASAPASPSIGPSTPPRRSSLSQSQSGAPILLLTPPEGTSSTNISPITVTLQPASSNPTTTSNATPAATATGTAPSTSLLSPLPAAASGSHRYTPSTSGLSFTQLPPGYQRQKNEDGWGMSLYTPRGAGHLSVPSIGGPPGHQSTPSATWGNSITVAQMEMFVRETSRAQELQRGHIRDESLFLPPASPSQSGHNNPQTFAPTGDPVLAAKLKERTSQVNSLKKQLSDLEDTIVQGKQLLADAQAKEAAHEKHIAELRAAWQQEWHENEAKLKEEYELREIAREKASSDERIAMLNAQLIIVHDEKVREERGHLAEQAERRRLEKEVETLNWDIKNLEDALKRERERVKLRPNEQSLKDWNELLNSLLKQERDTVSDLKQLDAVHRSAEEDLKRFTSLLMFKQKELQVQSDHITRDQATLDARRAAIEADGVTKFKASEEGKRLLALAEKEEQRLAEEAAAIERAKAEAAEREKAQAAAAAAAAANGNTTNVSNNGNKNNNNRSNRSGGIFSCLPLRNRNSTNSHKQAAQTPSTQAMT